MTRQMTTREGRFLTQLMKAKFALGASFAKVVVSRGR